MATTTNDDITVAEFGRLEGAIFSELRDGVGQIDIETLVSQTNLSDSKIHEAMRYLTGKHAYISTVGAGEWEIELPDKE